MRINNLFFLKSNNPQLKQLGNSYENKIYFIVVLDVKHFFIAKRQMI